MMDVFRLRIIEPGSIGFCSGLESIKSGNQLLAFLFGKNSRACDGARPSPVEREFLRQEPPVKFPGALEFIERRIRAAFEAASPHFPLACCITHRALAS